MTAPTTFLELLRSDRPRVGVELRPPRADLSHADAMEHWIDLFHSIKRLAAGGAPIYLTDNAVGQAEEENLQHLAANLAGEVDPAQIVPFLTCKHTLEYCVLYATRAHARGVAALTVVGGDPDLGAPRCVPHAADLRRILRERVPGLTLGGWVNPHRDPSEQLDYLLTEGAEAEFALSQIVSETDLPAVEALLDQVSRRGVEVPIVFGVFFYHGPNRALLQRLARFFPVPVEAVMDAFESGREAEEICASTIRTLRGIGADKVYVANLGARGVGPRYARILELSDDGSEDRKARGS